MGSSSGTIGVAVMGGGGRARGVVANLLRDSGRGVEVRSVYDPDPAMASACLEAWGSGGSACAGYEEAIAVPGVDWVMVFSPNAFHREHIEAAFAAGKHVFSEKPLATTIEDCQAIHRLHRESGLLFATGFVLRYAPLYRKAKEILESGRLGRLVSIDANENIAPDHGGYIMRNWRRLRRFSGPHILEKCCHDLDLLNWFCGDLPARVASFGGLDVFTPEHEPLRAKYGDAAFAAWPDPHAVESPFTSEKDLMDNQISILEYRNGVRVMFQATMCNAIPERRMYFSCVEGTMIAELYGGTLQYRSIGDAEATAVNLEGDGHGGGDEYIMKELYRTMVDGTPPRAGGEEGLDSAVVALALDEAASTGRIVDLTPVWGRMGR